MKRSKDFRSPDSVGIALRTLPMRIPWESTTCNPWRPLSWVCESLMEARGAKLSTYFSHA
jgi:hypothetical protein